LNVLFAVLLIWASYRLMKTWGLSPFTVFTGLVVMILATPLPTLVFIGMEHTLHAILTVLFIFWAAKVLGAEGDASRRDGLILCMLAVLLTACRYEGGFLVLIATFLLLCRKRFATALALGLAGALPPVTFGLISIGNGWHFLPNSLLLNTVFPKVDSIARMIHFLGYRAFRNIQDFPQILWIATIGSMFFFYCSLKLKKPIWHPSVTLALFMVSAPLAHAQFIRITWFYRHDAYLVAAAAVIFAVMLAEVRPQGGRMVWRRRDIPLYGMACLVCLLASAPYVRRAGSITQVVQATTNIHEQQYQMALFLAGFCQGQAVVANDIGAVTFVPDIRIIDLVGLATLPVADRLLSRTFDQQTIRDITKENGGKVAILYENWFSGPSRIPEQWVRAGTWTISDPVVQGGDTVTFFAVDPSEKMNLIRGLRSFAPKLPKSVLQHGVYLDGPEPADSADKPGGSR
jgi:hypothetical protein